MGGTEISLLLALAIMVVGGLFYSGKLGNFRLKKKGKELKLDIHAPNTNNLLPIPQTSPDININIDTNSLGQAADQVVEKFSHLTGSGILLVILAIVLPPVAVFFKLGITPHFWINITL